MRGRVHAMGCVCPVMYAPRSVRAVECVCRHSPAPNGHTKGQGRLPDQPWVQASKDGQSRSVLLPSVTETLECGS